MRLGDGVKSRPYLVAGSVEGDTPSNPLGYTNRGKQGTAATAGPQEGSRAPQTQPVIHPTDRMRERGVPGIYWLVQKICWQCKARMATDGAGTYWCAGACVPANFGRGSV